MPQDNAILLGLHLAGFATWSGFMAGYLLLGRDAMKLLQASVWAMPVTLLAGWALAFERFGTPAAWPWAVNAMQTTGLAMAVLLLVARFGAATLLCDAEAARDGEAMEGAERRLTRLIAACVALAALSLGFGVMGRFG